MPKIPNGCVLLSRLILDSAIWRDDPHILKLFLYFILTARYSHEPKKYGETIIKRGELIRSLSGMADDNEFIERGHPKKWSKVRVKRMIEKLEEKEYAQILDTRFGMHLKISNYDFYQDLKSYIAIDENRPASGGDVARFNTKNIGDCNGYETDSNPEITNNTEQQENNNCNGSETTAKQLRNDCETSAELYNKDNKDIYTSLSLTQKSENEEANLISEKIVLFNRTFSQKGINKNIPIDNTDCRGQLIGLMDYSLEDHKKVYEYVLTPQGWLNPKSKQFLTFKTIHDNFSNLLEQSEIPEINDTESSNSQTKSKGKRTVSVKMPEAIAN